MATFGNSGVNAAAGSQMNVYTALSLVGFLAMLLAVLWMVFHNMEYAKDYSANAEPGMFTILDE